ncbi:zf-HC2 domain-containing protein, partial [Burkholderia sp. Ac-20349]|uniref:anti-sigma factor family protein n=1 Tax=Burkholderia sp. Ac-20349 TaxID=2703893 RepID=UPI001F11F99C
MDCNEVRALLDADVDRELSAPDALRVQQHVEGCEACRRERTRIVALGRAVRQADRERDAPAPRMQLVGRQQQAQQGGHAGREHRREPLRRHLPAR